MTARVRTCPPFNDRQVFPDQTDFSRVPGILLGDCMDHRALLVQALLDLSGGLRNVPK
jgi:hypothetical protein